MMSNDGLIIENMDLSHIYLVALVAAIFNQEMAFLGILNYISLRWFSVGICKYKPGYKSHDLL
jgi:hypothetical protein